MSSQSVLWAGKIRHWTDKPLAEPYLLSRRSGWRRSAHARRI